MTAYPLILCSFDPAVIEAGLSHVKDRKPLIYAATKDNWKQMADIALKYECPLALFAPNDIPLLRSMVRTVLDYGVSDLVLDPGTFVDQGLSATINNFTMIRKAACKLGDELLSFPLVGTPITTWGIEEISNEVLQWKEAVISSMLISRYADLLILHSLEGWVLLPLLIWRFNIYTDPRKPVSVEPGVRTFGTPDKNSPVLLTTNYALTYFTVEADIKYGNFNCYLIVVDTGGISVESAVAGPARELRAKRFMKIISLAPEVL
jgi:acetyl-CoA decarbonylase/synthase complex subunit gamma